MDQRKELERLQAELDRLKAQLDDGNEQFVPKEGQLCCFWTEDDSPLHPTIGEFTEFDGPTYVTLDPDGNPERWNHCAPYIAKATRQEWSGGKCPVDEDALVAFQYKDGSIYTRLARDVVDWGSNNRGVIVAYWELDQ